MPELLWKAYIDFEISQEEYERTRQLYERLLDRTKHLKVWISCAKFEASAAEEKLNEDHDTERESDNLLLKCLRQSRGVFERAFDYYRTSEPELKEEITMLLEEWLDIKSSFGGIGDASLVQKKLPRKVKRKRPVKTEDGTPVIYEEYIDYIFPDEGAMDPNRKLLEAAYKWKKQKTAGEED